MKVPPLLPLIGLSLAMASAPLYADAQFNDAQKEMMGKVVHDYLVKNPEVLIEASQALQQKQQKVMQEQAQSAIGANIKALLAQPLTTVGNPKGDVTLVEFFDYQCVHCKKMAPMIKSLLAKNPQLRVVYHELPIFGKTSTTASEAALAAAKMHQYEAMHDKLIAQDKPLTEQIIYGLAKQLNLDLPKLKAQMDSKEIATILKDNQTLAEKLHLLGTPAFVIAATPKGAMSAVGNPVFIPGATSEDSLATMINDAGKK